MERKFKLTDVFKASWKGLISQIWILAGLLIGYTIICLSLNLFVSSPAENAMNISGVAISLLCLVLSLLFSLGYTKNLFQALDGEEPQFSAYGQESRKIITFLFASIIYTIVVCIGLVLLVFPGIYLAIRLQFFYTSIVDDNTGILNSFRRSWEITKGQEGPLVLLLLVVIGLTLLGLAFFIVGLFVVYPLIGLMNCYVYRKLTILAG